MAMASYTRAGDQSGNGDNKQGDKYTHVIAIDFGTSGCGMAVWNLKSESKEEIHMYSNWVPRNAGFHKCPTYVLLDHERKCEDFGLEAFQKYQSKSGLCYPEKADCYYLFAHFKMCLYEGVSIITNN